MRINPIQNYPIKYSAERRKNEFPVPKTPKTAPSMAQEVKFGAKESMFSRAVRWLVTSNEMKQDARIHHYLASRMKLYCDFYYGNNNYTTISIGRSMASINETLGKMHRNTVCLPLSHLMYGLPENIKSVDVYRKFLESRGLTKEIIAQNPEHHYILVDNAISGSSLASAKELLSREDLLGNPDRLETLSAQQIFGEVYNKLDLEHVFMYSEFHKYSPVGALEVSDLSDVFAQADLKTITQYKSNKLYLWRKKLFDLEMADRIHKNPKGNR